MHFVGPIWDHNKWFDSDKRAQSAYDIVPVMVTYDYSNVVVRAPSTFKSAEAVGGAIPTARLLVWYLAAAVVQGIGIASIPPPLMDTYNT